MKLFFTIFISLFTISFLANAQANIKKARDGFECYRKIDSLKKILNGYHEVLHGKAKNLNAFANNIVSRAAASCGYFCSNVVLPITGMELEGKRIDNEYALLTWKTFSENNNAGFDIERSYTSDALRFEKVNFVSGAGNSSTEIKYTKNDKNNFNGISYYRLKQIDFDGKFTYSNIAKVNGYKLAATITIYPNPGSNNDIIFFVTGLQNNLPVSIQITDAVGKKIYAKNFIKFNNQKINLQSLITLSTGFYVAVFIQNNMLVKQSFVVL